jgi:isoleucyl-tRNA synthetase
LLKLRSRVYEKIEGARQSGMIGKSLEAAVALRGPESNPEVAAALRNRDALAELLIVSQVALATQPDGELTIEVARAAGGRCPRCWRWIDAFADGVENTRFCPRCVGALRDR